MLERYEERSTLWLHFGALIEFRESGPSEKSRDAIRAAFNANRFVVEFLRSAPPPLSAEIYSAGSPEEAEICLDQIGEVWWETDGYVSWMIAEYERWQHERKKAAIRRKPPRKQKELRGSGKRRRK